MVELVNYIDLCNLPEDLYYLQACFAAFCGLVNIFVNMLKDVIF